METDSALQKIEKIEAPLAEVHQREASTDVTGEFFWVYCWW